MFFKIEVHNFISRILQTFYRIGFWDKEFGAFQFVRKMFHFAFMLSFLASLCAGAYLSDDTNEWIFSLAAGFTLLVEFVRVYKVIVEKNSFIAFLQYFGCHSTCDRKEIDQINEKLETFVKVTRSFFISCIVCTACVAVLPFVTKEKVFVFNIGLPLDWRDNEFSFCIVYTFTVVGSFYGLFSQLFSIILWYLMLNSTIKYEVLGNKLRKLGVLQIAGKTSLLDMVKVSNDGQQKLFLNELVEAIKSHRELDRMVDQFTECFEGVFFIQIGTSGICICGSIYSLVFNSDLNLIQIGVYCFFIIYCFFDIFVVMLLGNKIMEGSDRLSYCLFESDWIGQSHECKKLILIMAEVLKHPKEIIIYKLFPLNLETFTSILRGAYRIFNLLMNLK